MEDNDNLLGMAESAKREDKRIRAILAAAFDVLSGSDTSRVYDLAVEERTFRAGSVVSELTQGYDSGKLAAVVAVITAMIGTDAEISSIQRIRA